MGAGGFVNPTPSSVSPENLQIEEPQATNGVEHEKMRSGLFLVLHTIVNTVLLSSCAIYISATRDLSNEANNALVLPQVLAVVPGKSDLTKGLPQDRANYLSYTISSNAYLPT